MVGVLLVLAVVTVSPVAEPAVAHHCDPDEPPCESTLPELVKHIIVCLGGAVTGDGC